MRRARLLILLDANALLLPFRTRFPLREEIERRCPGAEVVVPASVVRELDALVARGVREAGPARELARAFRELPGSGRGDAGIVRAATASRGWVVTADRTLAHRLEARGVTVLSPRDRSRLEVRRGKSARRVARRASPGEVVRRRATQHRGKG